MAVWEEGLLGGETDWILKVVLGLSRGARPGKAVAGVRAGGGPFRQAAARARPWYLRDTLSPAPDTGREAAERALIALIATPDATGMEVPSLY